jgi:hypothetical protein
VQHATSPLCEGAALLALLRRATLAVCVFLAAAGLVRAAEGDEHLALGNPTGATADKGKPDNYLVRKRQRPDPEASPSVATTAAGRVRLRPNKGAC